MSETARRLWTVYIGFTICAAVAFLAADGFSSVYDAVAHAFTVAATGGFSVHADSIGHYDSVAVETVAIVFMILGGTSFSLHWRAVASRTLPYHRNSEFRSYLMMLGLAATVVVILLWLETGLTLGSSIRAGVFTVASLGTSTGLSNATGPGSPGDYVTWVAGAQLVLLFLMVVGGCTGSTSGGIKVMRMRGAGADHAALRAAHPDTQGRDPDPAGTRHRQRGGGVAGGRVLPAALHTGARRPAGGHRAGGGSRVCAGSGCIGAGEHGPGAE